MNFITKNISATLVINLFLLSVLAYSFHLIHIYDWNAGFKRGLVLITVIIFIILKNKYGSSKLAMTNAEAIILYTICIVLASGHVWYFIKYFKVSYPNDVGESSIFSIDLFWKSLKNPY